MATTATPAKEVRIDKNLSPREAAEILGVTEETLAMWRCTKRYKLAYYKVGRAVRYRLSDIEAWLATRKHTN